MMLLLCTVTRIIKVNGIAHVSRISMRLCLFYLHKPNRIQIYISYICYNQGRAMDSGMGEDFTYVPSYFIDPDIASKTG